MRGYPRLAAAGLLLAPPALLSPVLTSAASAQTAADSAVRAIDRAGESAAAKGAPGAVVPDTPGYAVAPGVQAPVQAPGRTLVGSPPRSEPARTAPAGK